MFRFHQSLLPMWQYAFRPCNTGLTVFFILVTLQSENFFHVTVGSVLFHFPSIVMITWNWHTAELSLLAKQFWFNSEKRTFGKPGVEQEEPKNRCLNAGLGWWWYDIGNDEDKWGQEYQVYGHREITFSFELIDYVDKYSTFCAPVAIIHSWSFLL